MLNLRLKRLGNRGDTIVEVMIVLAVLGLALAVSYSTANRSLLNARQAQENSEATSLLQAQIEQIHAYSSITDTSSPQYVYQGSAFCLADGKTENESSPKCVQGGRYKLSVVYSGNSVFTAKATWDDVAGGDESSVSITYRVNPQVHTAFPQSLGGGGGPAPAPPPVVAPPAPPQSRLALCQAANNQGGSVIYLYDTASECARNGRFILNLNPNPFIDRYFAGRCRFPSGKIGLIPSDFYSTDHCPEGSEYVGRN